EQPVHQSGVCRVAPRRKTCSFVCPLCPPSGSPPNSSLRTEPPSCRSMRAVACCRSGIPVASLSSGRSSPPSASCARRQCSSSLPCGCPSSSQKRWARDRMRDSISGFMAAPVSGGTAMLGGANHCGCREPGSPDVRRSRTRSTRPGLRRQDNLAAVLLLVVEDAIAAGRVRKLQAMRDDDLRIQLTGLDMPEHRLHETLHVRLAHAEGEALVEGITEQETVDETGINA